MPSLTLTDLPPPPPRRKGWPFTVADDGRSLDGGPWPRVTIVTPSYNQERFLEETIRSVLLQGYPDLEYIVLDGGSTDGSAEIIRRYEPWLSHWATGPDGGQTHALNLGFRRASGDVLAWINSDDAYLPGAIAKAVRALQGTLGAALAYGSASVVDERGGELRTWTARPFSIQAMLGQGNVVPQPAAFYTREALESVGFLDERWQMIMDFAVTMRVGLRFPSVCLPDHLARFRDHAASKSRRHHGAMARELLRLIDELEGEVGGSPDWPALRRRAVARVHYEWALACIASEGRADDAVGRHEAIRHLRSSLRSDPGFVLERAPQTAYLVKEVARAAISVRPRPSPEPHERSVDTAGHPLRVQLIGRFDDRITGLSRYTHGLRDGLLEAGLDVQLTFPPRPPIPAAIDRRLRATGIDIGSFFSSYPLRASLIQSDIYHLTDQMLATLLLFQRIPGPVVVTVMDIIPYLVQHSRELNTFRHQVDAWFYRLALAGLRRADALVVISEYTKATLVEVLGLPAERIHVIYPAIDHRRFRPMDLDQGFLQRYGLSSTTPYVLYVGSEDPRKNLSTLIRAIGRVREQRPDVVLLKVGQAQFVRERRRLSRLVQSLRLGESVRFLEAVPDADLPLFYNLASVCVLPSLYEGFGLPMAEAMACGTPVVHARSGPLPEVAGGAGIEVDARDPDAFAEAILRLMRDPAERTVLRQAGLREAARFTWRTTAAETRALYAGLVATGGSRG